MTQNKIQPLITFALFAYNQEKYIRDAVEGALSQTYSPLEIILSDDCSTDKTFEIIKDMAEKYQGVNKVIIRRNEENLGLIGHINKVMELVSGELIIGAAGDDISFSNRVERIYQDYITTDKQNFSIFSNGIWIDEKGDEMNPIHRKPIPKEKLTLLSYASRSIPGFINGCTLAFRKEVFEVFGPLQIDVGAEDIIIPFRSALLGRINYIHEPLIYYRRHLNRKKSHNGNYSFSKYRKSRMNQIKFHINMYKSRLQDIQKYKLILKGGNNIDINEVEKITLKRLSDLENNQPSILKIWLSFMIILLYFSYQNFWRSILQKNFFGVRRYK